MNDQNKRPALNKEISVTDFIDFYWLKEELIEFCREEGIKKSGGKLEISERILRYLKTGKKESASRGIKRTATSKFNWNSEALTPETRITDNYKSSENVRTFFQEQIGPRFKFNVPFMNWIKANQGKTLGDAIKEWYRIKDENKTDKQKKEIAPQFEYNRYLRDFLADNPDKDRKTGIDLWKIKRNLRGDNVYRPSDLKLLD